MRTTIIYIWWLFFFVRWNVQFGFCRQWISLYACAAFLASFFSLTLVLSIWVCPGALPFIHYYYSSCVCVCLIVSYLPFCKKCNDVWPWWRLWWRRWPMDNNGTCMPQLGEQLTVRSSKTYTNTNIYEIICLCLSDIIMFIYVKNNDIVMTMGNVPNRFEAHVDNERQIKNVACGAFSMQKFKSKSDHNKTWRW